MNQVGLHLVRVHDNAIGKAILGSKGQAIDKVVVAGSRSRVDVVSRQHNRLAECLVVQHQQRAIDRLELVVPEDVEYRRFRSPRVANEPAVIGRDPGDLAREARPRLLVLSEVEQHDSWPVPQFGAVQIVPGDDLESDPLGRQRRRQPEGVWPVAPTGEQGHLTMVRTLRVRVHQGQSRPWMVRQNTSTLLSSHDRSRPANAGPSSHWPSAMPLRQSAE